ncbi:MAG TPA: OmpA family protein [Methylomirabilota bacterium]|nr:OmpA family protein [Methylomirabilota bacterium]
MTIHRLSACAVILLIVAGCAKPALPPPPTPVQTADTSERSFDEAVAVATDSLVAQLQQRPSTKPEARRAVVIDPMVDAVSGQQTATTHLLEQRVAERLQSSSQLGVIPFQVANLSQAQYLLTGTMARVPSSQSGAPPVFQLNLALTDLKEGTVVAQASSRARDEGLDTNPTPYYRDSPVVVKDKVVDGYIATSQTAPGRPADPAYFERVATATTVSEATVAYNSGSYQDALALYQNAALKPGGEQLRVLNGIYLASWKLGRASEAEEAFGKVVAAGLSNNNLGVKFLFNPGSTNFWSDRQVSGPYGFWLRQIARQAAAAKVCMNVVGHTSLTGSQAYNDRLSLQRAVYIKKRLDTEAPELAARTKAAGMGFRENLVGTGTDDARDALDRRVEFKITECS